MTKERAFQILEISPTSDKNIIKKAFRKMAHIHHPDKQGGDTEKMKELNNAYDILYKDKPENNKSQQQPQQNWARYYYVWTSYGTSYYRTGTTGATI